MNRQCPPKCGGHNTPCGVTATKISRVWDKETLKYGEYHPVCELCYEKMIKELHHDEDELYKFRFLWFYDILPQYVECEGRCGEISWIDEGMWFCSSKCFKTQSLMRKSKEIYKERKLKRKREEIDKIYNEIRGK